MRPSWLQIFLPSKPLQAPSELEPVLARLGNVESVLSAIQEQLGGLGVDLQSYIQGQNRSTRKVHLSLEQLLQMSKDLHLQMKQNPRSSVRGEGLYLSDKEALGLLDRLDSELALDESTASVFGWKPTARKGFAFADQDCEVVDAIPTEDAEGTILGVIQQGYRRQDGSLVRKARVIVTRLPAEMDMQRDQNFSQENGL